MFHPPDQRDIPKKLMIHSLLMWEHPIDWSSDRSHLLSHEEGIHMVMGKERGMLINFQLNKKSYFLWRKTKSLFTSLHQKPQVYTSEISQEIVFWGWEENRRGRESSFNTLFSLSHGALIFSASDLSFKCRKSLSIRRRDFPIIIKFISMSVERDEFLFYHWNFQEDDVWTVLKEEDFERKRLHLLLMRMMIKVKWEQNVDVVSGRRFF